MKGCAVEGCPLPHYGLGWCRRHWYRFKSNGDPNVIRPKRPPRLCTIDGCGKRLASHGLCPMHLARLTRRGDPLAVPLKDMTLRDSLRGLSPLERFVRRLTTPSGLFGCWEWNGALSKAPPFGYGRFPPLKERTGETLTHRIAYVLVRGRIPTELQIDHLCRNRRCCNPWHLEVVTHAVNMHRGMGYSGVNHRKTHCNNGHPLTGENMRMEAYGSRRCVACARKAKARHKAKLRAAR